MNNERVLLSGNRLRLVPYLARHVPRYHEWMCSSELCENTASERLTLEEEYANQREWLCAEDKLTFILLAPLSLVLGKMADEKHTSGVFSDFEGREEEVVAVSSGGGGDGNGDLIQLRASSMFAPSGGAAPKGSDDVHPSFVPRGEKGDSRARNTYVMVGDCNLFRINKYEVMDAEEEAGRVNCVTTGAYFEVSVMVADCVFRRMGLGEEAVRLLMSYAMDQLGATCFVAKILNTNTPSIRLFTKKLGFRLLKEVPVFNELHFVRYFLSAEEREAWAAVAGYKTGIYSEAAEGGMTVLESVPEEGPLR